VQLVEDTRVNNQLAVVTKVTSSDKNNGSQLMVKKLAERKVATMTAQ